MKNSLIFLITFLATTVFGKVELKQNPTHFLPKGFVIFEKIYGDLNKDGIEDCVLIIKGIDKTQIITDENGAKLDRNRRGIIVLFNQKENYKLASKNHKCFSSENEDGGIYFPPDLWINIKNEKLYIHYGHGRYGYWEYTFKYKNSDFELIGYNRSNGGAVIESETSMNFLTKKKCEKVNINKNAKSGDEIFKELWKSININRLIKLSEIKDFDQLDMSLY